MINGKYCSCTLPVDLEPSELGLSGEALNGALEHLDSDGWNKDSPVGRTAWLRMSALTMKLREEILEVSLGVDTAQLEERAR